MFWDLLVIGLVVFVWVRLGRQIEAVQAKVNKHSKILNGEE